MKVIKSPNLNVTMRYECPRCDSVLELDLDDFVRREQKGTEHRMAIPYVIFHFKPCPTCKCPIQVHERSITKEWLNAVIIKESKS